MSQAQFKLGRYLICEEIASGGMAVVYRGKLIGIEGFEKDFAIKKILAHWSKNPTFINMLIDEAKILVHLHHPNIVQIFELAKEGENYFIVMEYIHGCDLKKIFKQLKSLKHPFPLKHITFIAKAICDGLSFAHHKIDENGQKLDIVHRDISPQNILIGWDGQIKLTDFGIAKVTGKSTKTQTGTLKGKFAYMSPEQAMGENIDQQTDIFALGAVLYEMALGKKCFDGENDLKILESVKKGEIQYPQNLHPKLKVILEKALASDKQHRYKDIDDLKSDLLELEKDLPQVATQRDFQFFLKETFEKEITQQKDFKKQKEEEETRILKETALQEPALLLAKPGKNPYTVVSKATLIHDKTEVEGNKSQISNKSHFKFKWFIFFLLLALGSLAFIFINHDDKPRLTSQKTTTSKQTLALKSHSSQEAKKPNANQKPKITILPQSSKKQTHTKLIKPMFGRVIIQVYPKKAQIKALFKDKKISAQGLLKQEITLKAEDKIEIPITVSLEGYEDFHDTIEIRPDQLQVTKEVHLKKIEFGKITLQARPWGIAKIKNTEFPQKETPASYDLPAGEYDIQIYYPPAKKAVTKKIKITANSHLQCRASFSEKKSLVCQ